MTYASSGVDREAQNRAISILKSVLRFRRRGEGAAVGAGIARAGLIRLGGSVFAMCTDAVGTKTLIAQAMGRWDTIGEDCIAMVANDLAAVGAWS